MIRKAVIPAAGFGVRFLPATKAMPKEMLPVVDTPVIQYVVEEAVAAGITDILVIIGRGKRAIEEHFDRSPLLEQQLAAKGDTARLARLRRISEMAEIHFVWQREMRGLGDAVWCARHHVGDEPFAVLLGDCIVEAAGSRPVTRQLMDVYEEFEAPVVAVQEVPRERVSRYGVMKGRPVAGRNGLYEVEDWVEKPSVAEAPSNLVVSARYVLTPDVFGHIAETPPGKNDEVQLADAFRSQLRVRGMYGLQYAGRRYDVGNKVDFVKTNVAFALRHDDIRGELTDYLRGLVREL